jgi:trypsin-like peptidase
MYRSLILRSIPCLAILSLVSCKGCVTDTSTHAIAGFSEDGGGDDLQVLDTSVFHSAGETDFKNRYLSTVMVTTGTPWESKICSGVLIASRLALTAAHCLCDWRKLSGLDGGHETIIDSAACAKAAYVTTVTYDPLTARAGTGGQTRVYEGTVLPHPEFQLLLDHREQVLSGKADLALIRLSQPVEEQVPMIPLADTPVRLGEPLVMAGYGHGSAAGAIYGLRFFRRNRVARLATPTDERVLYEQQGAYLYNGFDGGPCFREEGQVRWLVGIASSGSEKELALTDTHPYLDWLRAAIEDARLRSPMKKEDAP